MESQELLTLATNAEQNYWPPHLGVTTDAEKIDYLARHLREAGDAESRADDLADQLEAALNDRGGIDDENADLKNQVEDLQDEIKSLELKIQAAKDALS